MYQPPQAHQKYEIYEDEMPPGQDLMWLPTKIAGMSNPRVGQYYRAGWMPAKAEEFPRVSGYGVDFPQAMIDAGLLENVPADAPIVIDDQMLVMRPKEISKQAERERISDANAQVDNQMRRLKQAGRNYSRTEIRRGQMAPLPDAPRPSDDGYEE